MMWGIWMTAVAGLTAFYMFRLYYRIFWWNNPDYSKHHHTPHDAPWTMTLPLILLATVSCVAGFIPFGELVTWNREAYEIHLNYPIAITSVVVALCAIGLATIMYRKENSLPDKVADKVKGLWTAAYHRFYFDELYLFITHKIIFNLVSRPIAWFDRQIIDGTMDKFAEVTNKASEAIKGLQSGRVQSYVLVYLLGALLVGVVTVICMVL